MKVSVIAGGRFHAFHLAHQLIKHNALHKLYTFSYTKKDASYVPTKYIKHFTLPALLDTAYQKARLYKLIQPSRYNVIKDNLFDQQVCSAIDPFEADIFVFWAHYGLKSMQKIRKANPKAKIIVESGSCHILEQRALLQKEYVTAKLSVPPVSRKNSDKMLAEYQLSDAIMTPSEFVRQSFLRQGFNSETVFKVAYGANITLFKQDKEPKKKANKYRVIFVGLLSLQKGVHYLIDAWNNLEIPDEDCELLLVGSWRSDLKHYLANKKLKKNIIFYGGTTQQKLKELYNSSDLFVLPSIQEGLAMVTGEAMACGLPVICTTHTGADELISNGVEGFLVPAGNSNILVEKIHWCYNNQERAQEMGRLGMNSIQKSSWNNYGNTIITTYRKIMSNGNNTSYRQIQQ